jgi:hypothetical protein
MSSAAAFEWEDDAAELMFSERKISLSDVAALLATWPVIPEGSRSGQPWNDNG